MTTEEEDIFGGPPPEDTSEEPAPGTTESLRKIAQGVTITWLMEAFQMDRRTIKRRLSPLDPVRMERGNSPIYDFKQAVAYLIPPKVNIAKHLAGMSPRDLPPDLQEAYWGARLKRQKWEENAGDLWRTGQVVEVLSEVFKLTKESMQLWVDNMEQENMIDGAQREFFQGMVDGLQTSIHDRVVALTKGGVTKSQLAEADQQDADALAELEMSQKDD